MGRSVERFFVDKNVDNCVDNVYSVDNVNDVDYNIYRKGG